MNQEEPEWRLQRVDKLVALVEAIEESIPRGL